MRFKKKLEKTDALHFEASNVLDKFRKEQWDMTVKVYTDFPEPIIWKPERNWLKRI